MERSSVMAPSKSLSSTRRRLTEASPRSPETSWSFWLRYRAFWRCDSRLSWTSDDEERKRLKRPYNGTVYFSSSFLVPLRYRLTLLARTCIELAWTCVAFRRRRSLQEKSKYSLSEKYNHPHLPRPAGGCESPGRAATGTRPRRPRRPRDRWCHRG